MSNIEKKPIRKTGLGRGLGSLLGNQMEERTGGFTPNHIDSKSTIQNKVSTQAASQSTNGAALELPIEVVVPNREQPRREFKQSELAELAASIKQKGIIQPILVRKIEGNDYQIIAGERRWRAAQIAGLKRVPVVVKQVDVKETLELALIENIQRENLNPVEEAEAYQLLINKYKLTQQELADRVGKDRASVANMLRLNRLTKDVRGMVLDGQISLGQAKVLLGIEDLPTQKRLAKRAVKAGLSVRALEKLVKKALNPSQPNFSTLEVERIGSSAKLVRDLSLELQRSLGTKVEIDFDGKKGKISIDFYSIDGLNHIAEKLR